MKFCKLTLKLCLCMGGVAIFHAKAVGILVAYAKSDKKKDTGVKKEKVVHHKNQKGISKKIIRTPREYSITKSNKVRTQKTKSHDKKIDRQKSFWLFSCETKDQALIKKVIIDQAKIVLKQGLKKTGVSERKLDDAVQKMVESLEAACRLEKDIQENISLSKEKQKQLTAIKNRTPEQEQELAQQIEHEKELLQQKKDQEDVIGIFGTTLAHLMGDQIGSKTNEKLITLFNQLKLPGAAYGNILAQLVMQVLSTIKVLKTDNFEGFEGIAYYLGTYQPGIGGWMIGQNTVNGKLYIRLDQPAKLPGYVHVEQREIIIPETTPFISFSDQIAKILAGNFQLGEARESFQSICTTRNWVSNVFGY